MEGHENVPIAYEKNQLVEVICQLRFPTILSIDSHEPADFQDTVRRDFPRYMQNSEKQQTGSGEQTLKNYVFISADGMYKLNLTRHFIALSTVKYTNWTEFANRFDRPLVHFIEIYKPAYFERVGIRYINAFSRNALELQGCPWRELISKDYLGPLGSAESNEEDFARCSVDTEQRLGGGCSMKLHAGPGFIQRRVKTNSGVQQLQEKEQRFIFDMDVYISGDVKLQEAVSAMGRIHSDADRVFSSAITDKLREAMKPGHI